MAEAVVQMAKDSAAGPKKSKRDKFVEIAEKRTVNAIKAIRVIGKLGNRAAYDYDEEDVRKIVKALTDEVEGLKNRMKTTRRSSDVEFRL
jgi:hypothetical protein